MQKSLKQPIPLQLKRNKLPSRPYLVFLHGFLGNHKDFHLLAQNLNAYYTCILIDLPGNGYTPLPSQIEDLYTYTLEHIKTFLEEHRVNKCHIAGYSMGGRLALLFAQKYPHFVDKVIILSAHPGIDERKLLEDRKVVNLHWTHLINTHTMEKFIYEWYSQPLFASLKKRLPLFQKVLKNRKNLNNQDVGRVFSTLNVSQQKPLWDFLSQTKLPILFLFGSLDKQFVNIYKRIKKNIKSVQSKLILNAGHALHIESPKRCAHEIKLFIGS